ncbi:NAD(+) diphosphatase [Paucibacter sp. O1-1]|nr:NAD(+) diphosphatase [Paucibacter sp. O1-1]MDA3829950.1 NAD(+) diphosphatase [Paucibacter sp. O1-1]
MEWDRSHRFCGACGTATELQAGERARRCPACGHTAYPRLSPAMMALVWRPGELLLARAPHYSNGMYSALAGFVEAGESLEDCLHREVAEEVGVAVTGLRYFGSQSWPFPHSLMVAYTARWTRRRDRAPARRDCRCALVSDRRAASHPAAAVDRRPPDPRHRGGHAGRPLEPPPARA